jgi:carbonic anhydrase
MTDKISPTSCSCHASSVDRELEPAHWSRRGLLGTALGGASVGLVGAVLLVPSVARAQSALTPGAALALLMEGNARFVERKLTFFDEDLAILQQNTIEKQEPFASVLSCADSRVPVELLFDQSIGHVFVNRVAGNIATSEIIASIEYGIAVLGTRVLMVLGHSSCGAVKAAIAAKAVPGQISALYSYIRPAVNAANGDLEGSIKANAKIQAGLLREASPIVADAIKAGTLSVVAAYYDLISGKVAILT